MHKAGKWKEWQIQAVTRMYPTCELAEIAKEVGRSENAISHFASRNGLKKDKATERKHRSEARKGEGTPNFKGYRRKTSKGYYARYVPWHPYSGANGLVMEHRLVIEGLIGRYLEPDEVVHHIDGNKQNNDPSNLKLMKNGEHSIYHNKRRHKK